jgi:hypothetical protein
MPPLQESLTESVHRSQVRTNIGFIRAQHSPLLSFLLTPKANELCRMCDKRRDMANPIPRKAALLHIRQKGTEPAT